MATIFIQIASYRDPQLSKTIESCLKTANFPENLRFGIVNQYSPEDAFNKELDPYRDDDRFQFMDVIWNESKGACWARARTQKMYKDETYTMQIDSHMRFSQGWDTYHIDAMAKTGSVKPFLTAYVGAFEVEKEMPDQVYTPFVGFQMVPNRMTLDATIHTIGTSFPLIDNTIATSPVPGRFASGHFFFTLGQHCQEYVYDENMYFDGEEVHIAVVSYTLGYDIYHPDQNYIWHDYCSYPRSKHWGDHENVSEKVELEWWKRDARAKRRLRKLLGVEENDEELGPVKLGTVRSVAEYEAWAGVDFARRRIHVDTLAGKLPPTVENGDKSWCEDFIQFWYNFENWVKILAHEKPVNYYIGFDDEYGKAIHFEWMDAATLESKKQAGVMFSFVSKEKPVELVLWGLNDKGEFGGKLTHRLSL